MPGSGCADSESSGRIHNARVPPAGAATKTMRFPSGDTAGTSKPRNAVLSGGAIVKRTGGLSGARSRQWSVAGTSVRSQSRPRPPASSQASRSRLRRRSDSVAGTPACEPASPIQRSSLATSWALCQRSSGILLQALLHDVVERRRRHRLDRRDRRRLGREDRRDQARLRLAVEGAPPRRHLVEERPEREDVGPRVGLRALELLGRHVLERAEDRPRGGERPGLRRKRGRIRESAESRRRIGRGRSPGASPRSS